ncbi:MAG: BLUF domain-containing protein [Curtobacterium sp.]
MTSEAVDSATDGPLLSLVYSSRAVVGFGLDALDELLVHARTANESVGITGLLLYKDHRFLQLLEGPETAVREKMTYITEDPRHDHVTVLLEEQVPERQFPGWTMGYAAEDALQHADVPGYRTTFDDIDFLPDDHEAGPVVPALRELIRWFRVTRPGGTERATAQPED